MSLVIYNRARKKRVRLPFVNKMVTPGRKLFPGCSGNRFSLSNAGVVIYTNLDGAMFVPEVGGRIRLKIIAVG